MTTIRHPEWRGELENTKYPFVDAATLESDSGGLLSELLLIDATLYPINATLPLRLSQIDVTPNKITVYVADATDNVVLSGYFATNSIPDSIKLVDSYGRNGGLLVSEAIRWATLTGLTRGSHTFAQEATEFVLSVCAPMPEGGVTGILTDDGDLLTGDVVLLADGGIVFTHTEETVAAVNPYGSATTFQQLRIDVVGDPLFRRRLCTDSEKFTTPQFIERICVTTPAIDAVGALDAVPAQHFCITPDAYGDILLLVGNNDSDDTVLRIDTTQDGIVFSTVGEKTSD